MRYQLADDPVLASWGIRFVTVNNYLAFYTVSESTQTVYILRFLHSRRDWSTLLKQDDFP
ncbi:MAG: type II toxin-antitoxin system RelE/ParE family toxin [Clostridiales bacterium]|nr:type II toxin-antitoxin system RelE/ParE family toxin [Clostridiales bacterium]